MSDATPAVESRTRTRAALLSFLLLSWLLLVWQLDQRSLWVDEFLTAQIVDGSWQDVVAHASADIHPPLYFLALHTWTLAAGNGDFALRWFSVGAGLASVALMPVVTRRLLGPRAALIATGLLAISPAMLEFSRMARYYSMLVLFGLLSTKFLFDGMRDGRLQNWVGYGLAGLALVYTFYPSGMLLVAQGLCCALPSRRRVHVKNWLISLGAITLAFVPWFVLAAGRQAFATSSNAGVDFARSALGWLLGVAASLYTFSVGETVFPWHPFAWLGLLLTGIALLAGRRTRGWTQLLALSAVCIVGMSFVTTYVSAGTPFLNVPVRVLFVLPLFIMLISTGLSSPRLPFAYVASGLLLVWAFSSVNQFAGQQFLNPIYLTPSKDAAAFVRARLMSGDLLVSDQDSVVGRYLPPSASAPWHVYTDQREQIERILSVEQPARVWLITIGRDQSERFASAEPVRQLLIARYHFASTDRFLSIDPLYVQVKNLLLRRNSYEYRLTVELYTNG